MLQQLLNSYKDLETKAAKIHPSEMYKGASLRQQILSQVSKISNLIEIVSKAPEKESSLSTRQFLCGAQRDLNMYTAIIKKVSP